MNLIISKLDSDFILAPRASIDGYFNRFYLIEKLDFYKTKVDFFYFLEFFVVLVNSIHHHLIINVFVSNV